MTRKLLFVPHISSDLNDAACGMYQTHGPATHEAQTVLDETVLLFPLHNGERLALCYRIDEYGDHEEEADEWQLEESDLEDRGDGCLILSVSAGIF